MKVFIFSAWGLRTHYFSWDRSTRSGAGNGGKGCTQEPSFELETSIMAHHSSTTAGQAAGVADPIFPQSKGFQASHFWTIPKRIIQHSPRSQGMESSVSPQGSISTQSILAPCNALCSTLKCTQDRGCRSQVSLTALQNLSNISLEPPPADVMVWLGRLGG